MTYLLEELQSQEFNPILAYLSEIFTRMNNLSLSFQGKNMNISNCYKKLHVFKDNLSLCLWCRRATRRNYSNFSSLGKIVDDNESSSWIPSVCEEFLAHLEVLLTSFDSHFDVRKMEASKE